MDTRRAERKARHDEIIRTVDALMESLRSRKADEIAQYKDELARDHAVVQLTMDGESVEVWRNAHQAEMATNIKNIRQVARGLRESAGGYRWEFLD